MKKIDNGKHEARAAIARHKGIIARFRVEYPAKRHARRARRLIRATRNHTRGRAFGELKAIIDGKAAHSAV